MLSSLSIASTRAYEKQLKQKDMLVLKPGVNEAAYEANVTSGNGHMS